MESVARQVLQILRDGMSRAGSIAKALLLACAFLASACGFGTGRHSDDNRSRRAPVGCAQTIVCVEPAHWDPNGCRCVAPENPDAATSVASESSDSGTSAVSESLDGATSASLDGPSSAAGTTDAEEGQDGNQ